MNGLRRVSLIRKFLRNSTAVAELVNQVPAPEDNNIIGGSENTVRGGYWGQTSKSHSRKPARNRPVGRVLAAVGFSTFTETENGGEQSQGGAGQFGRRYPARERRMNTKLVDYEVNSLKKSGQKKSRQKKSGLKKSGQPREKDR